MATILVVDDDVTIRTTLRLVLQKRGFGVLEAANGEEVAAVLRMRSADIVICDLIMPRGDGLETIRAIRRNYPRVRIIAMSGGGRAHATDLLQLAAEFGADHVLAKPFSNDEMLALVGACLSQERPSVSVGSARG